MQLSYDMISIYSAPLPHLLLVVIVPPHQIAAHPLYIVFLIVGSATVGPAGGSSVSVVVEPLPFVPLPFC